MKLDMIPNYSQSSIEMEQNGLQYLHDIRHNHHLNSQANYLNNNFDSNSTTNNLDYYSFNSQNGNSEHTIDPATVAASSAYFNIINNPNKRYKSFSYENQPQQTQSLRSIPNDMDSSRALKQNANDESVNFNSNASQEVR